MHQRLICVLKYEDKFNGAVSLDCRVNNIYMRCISKIANVINNQQLGKHMTATLVSGKILLFASVFEPQNYTAVGLFEFAI